MTKCDHDLLLARLDFMETALASIAGLPDERVERNEDLREVRRSARHSMKVYLQQMPAEQLELLGALPRFRREQRR